MAYVPPHRKNGKNARIANRLMNEKNEKIEKIVKLKKEDFPELGTNITSLTPIPNPTKMDFSKLFQKRRELKKRQYRMKKGWVKLTFNGIIDSLTEEERKEEDLYHTHYIMKANLDNLVDRIENDLEERIEMFPEFEPEFLEFSSSSEEYSESSEESLAEDPEEDEKI
jgi:hypothetical protein